MQVPPLPYRQPPQTEEAKRYLERVHGLEANMRELLVQKECLEKKYIELKASEAKALSEMHRARTSELKITQRMNDATASEKRAICSLQHAQTEIQRYKEILLDKLGPIQCPQSWRNLVLENDRLKKEVQRLLYQQRLQGQRRQLDDHVESP